MNGLLFYVGLGLGLAAACGLRPYLPTLLAGALAAAGALGVSFTGHFHFLQAGWWLIAVGLVFVTSYLLQLRLDQERFRALVQPAIAAQAVGVGALLFAGTLDAHGDAWWPGLIGGAAAALLALRATGPVVLRARARLPDRAAREALTLYVDSASLALAGLVALVHPLGYVAVALLAWFAWRGRARGRDDRYAGLRILRR